MRRLFSIASAASRLGCDARGTSVIELAVIAPLMTLVTMGIIDLSNGYSRRLELTQAADRTITKIAARNFEIPKNADGPDFSAYKAEAATAAGVDASAVTVVAWLECDGVEQDDFEGTCPKKNETGCEAESPPPESDCWPILARYIQVRIDAAFTPMFGSVISPRSDGTVPLYAEAAVRIQ
jgi:hypothetical protein